MDDWGILTIGYGARSVDEFVALLRTHRVEYLVDVRSAPFSRYKPEFAKDALSTRLDAEGIRYVFMGRELGGRPQDPAYSTADGRVDYAAYRLDESFQRGIEVLESGVESGFAIALMCSEGKPEQCHRVKLIGEELVKLRIPVTHVDEHGGVLAHTEVLDRLDGGQELLFGSPPEITSSRKQYRVA